VRGRIVKRTKSTADVEWANGRVRRGVKFTDPDLRWLTTHDLAAEDAVATRWPDTVRTLDGAATADTDAVTPDQAPHGRALPTELTQDGQTILRKASVAVRAVEKQLFSPLSREQQLRLRQDLPACVASPLTNTVAEY
jgi:hypothetical protein